MAQEKKAGWLEKILHGFGLDHKESDTLKDAGLLRTAKDELRAYGLMDDKTGIAHAEQKERGPVAQYEQQLAKRSLDQFLASNAVKPGVQKRDPDALKEFTKTSWVPQIFKDIAGAVKFGRESEESERVRAGKPTIGERLKYAFFGQTHDMREMEEQGLLRTAKDELKSYAVPFARDNTSLTDVPDARVSALPALTQSFAKAAPKTQSAPALAVPVWNMGSYGANADKAPESKAPATVRPVTMAPPSSRPN